LIYVCFFASIGSVKKGFHKPVKESGFCLNPILKCTHGGLFVPLPNNQYNMEGMRAAEKAIQIAFDGLYIGLLADFSSGNKIEDFKIKESEG